MGVVPERRADLREHDLVDDLGTVELPDGRGEVAGVRAQAVDQLLDPGASERPQHRRIHEMARLRPARRGDHQERRAVGLQELVRPLGALAEAAEERVESLEVRIGATLLGELVRPHRRGVQQAAHQVAQRLLGATVVTLRACALDLGFEQRRRMGAERHHGGSECAALTHDGEAATMPRRAAR